MPFEAVYAPDRLHVSARLPALMAAILLLAFLVFSAPYVVNPRPAVGFDELAHVSFVAQIQQCGCLPSLTELRLLDPVTMKFTSTPNYLNHPPSYYALLSLGPDIVSSLPTFRAFNIFLVGLAMALLFATLVQCVVEPLPRLAGVVMVGTVPVLAQLAGTVNNDNLAILGGAITMFAGARYLRQKTIAHLIIMCGGVLVASLAKLTGLMLCAIFAGAILVQAKSAGRHHLLAAFALALAALPYVILTLQFGTPAPNTAGQMKMLMDDARAAGWDKQVRLGPIAYFFFFCRSMLEGWLPRFGSRTTLQHAVLLLPLMTFALAARYFLRDAVCRAGAIAVTAMFAVHITFSYQRHLQTGWMLDAYPRYYFPMLGLLPLAVIVALRNLPRGFAYPVIAAPIAFALLG